MPLTTVVGLTQRIIVPNARQEVQVVGYGPKGDPGSPGPIVPIQGLPDVSDETPLDGDALFYDLGTGLWRPVPAATQAELDAKVAKAGDTMTGNLIIPTGTLSGHAVNKGQMDAADALKLNLTGGTISGLLSVADRINIGDDAYFEDINEAHTMALRSQSDVNQGIMKLGSQARVIGTTGYIQLQGGTAAYHDSDVHIFRNSAGYDWVHIDEVGGTGGIYFSQGGGGWYMSDGLWVRAYGGKGIYTTGIGGFDGGLAVNNNGSLNILGANWAAVIDDNAGGAGAALAVYGQIHARRPNNSPGSGSSWGTKGLILSSQTGGSDDNGGLAIWVDGIAPMLGAHAATGEKLQILSNGGTGYIPALASAFTVSSTLRIKTDVQIVEEDVLLDKVKKVKGIKFRNKDRPSKLRPNARFQELDTAWQAKGHTPLQRQPKHMEPGIHDCSIDECIGTAEDPCCIILNDTERFGLAAEDLYEILPEVVELDPERRPAGYDVDQVASLALTLVGALARKVEVLENQLSAIKMN